MMKRIQETGSTLPDSGRGLEYSVENGSLDVKGDPQRVRALMARITQYFDANPDVRLSPDELMGKFAPGSTKK